MSKNKKILFLHGFFASGQCIPALALRQAFQGTAEVLTPDLPQHPDEALRLVRAICASEHPDVLVGNSCGAFYAQMVASVEDIPALLGNPHFQMTDFLRPRIGAHQFKSPRADGRQQFVIDEPLIAEFARLQAVQFSHSTSFSREHVWGLRANTCGDSLAFTTRWPTSSPCSSSTTATRSISPATTRPRPKR